MMHSATATRIDRSRSQDRPLPTAPFHTDDRPAARGPPRQPGTPGGCGIRWTPLLRDLFRQARELVADPAPPVAPAPAAWYGPIARVVLTDEVNRTLFGEYAAHRDTDRGGEETGWVLLGVRDPDRVRQILAKTIQSCNAANLDYAEVARIPGLKPNGDAALEAELLSLLGRTETRAVPYGTEAGIFQNAGAPSVVIGPGDIADAHQPDESIAIDALESCVAFLTRVGETCR